MKQKLRFVKKVARCKADVHDLGFKLINEGPYIPIQTDKDGGFCLIDKECLYRLQFGILHSASYKSVFSWSGLQEGIFNDYLTTCIATAGDDINLKKALTHDVTNIKN